ncbi:hypothetical protein [Shouchella patagoniensis]|uniref:hypothetical protein n=1 Tax=Shouchella patagoniensis TaxID=228576 RepID=UPI0009953DC7|nr:hypothetical protein [Shouchella patagoniensis]
MVDTINRDNGDKSKGFRLQRLRAISLLLDKMDLNDDKVHVFASTEYLDDVYIRTVSPQGLIINTEGDKNYDPNSKFSFMSKEVTNSLIIFLDNWLNCDMSESMYYCFYTNINYTNERNSKLLEKLKIKLPQKPMLDYLIIGEYDEVIDCIKKRLLYEYEEQYKGKKGQGYIEILQKFESEDWRKFLDRINWKFGQYDDKDLERKLIKKIKERSFLNYIDVLNKEDYVIDLLENVFSKKEQLPDAMSKHVTSEQVENIFLRLSRDAVIKEEDPVYAIWNDLDQPTDNRGLEEKFQQANESYKKRKIGLKARDVAAIKEEYRGLTDIEKGSFRYRIFEACQRKLNVLLDREETSVDIDIWLEDLFEAAKKHLEDKSKDYSYPIKSDDAIKGAILELIDSCFLSFDEKGFYNGNV